LSGSAPPASKKATRTTSPSPRKRLTIPGHKEGGNRKEEVEGEIKMQSLKQELDNLYNEINKPEFILTDPVQFPHRYSERRDKEIAAFLAATIAWGRRDQIVKSAEKMFSLMGPSPYFFIIKEKYRKMKFNDRGHSIHRTFFEGDFLYFCKGLKACYTKYDSLETIFSPQKDIWAGIELFRETMALGNSGESITPVYSKHIANPAGNSACKRLNLALRWLVRREGPVDLCLWKSISPSSLFIPLDLHVGEVARGMGLLERKSDDRKAVISLTERLREFCPKDPVKYDLALFGYGINS
jgi:uncharacterized protein (TIGR02757 family)